MEPIGRASRSDTPSDSDLPFLHNDDLLGGAQTFSVAWRTITTLQGTGAFGRFQFLPLGLGTALFPIRPRPPGQIRTFAKKRLPLTAPNFIGMFEESVAATPLGAGSPRVFSGYCEVPTRQLFPWDFLGA